MSERAIFVVIGLLAMFLGTEGKYVGVEKRRQANPATFADVASILNDYATRFKDLESKQDGTPRTAAAPGKPKDKGMYNPKLFQGDILLTPDQKAAIRSGGDPSLMPGRATVNKPVWPNAVLPYTIDATLARNPRGMAAIRAGMKLWTDTTCVRFKRRTNERNYAHLYIGGGCTSYVGPVGGRQLVSLEYSCWHPYIVAHELGHALGFYHEQSRPDRDNYVQIIWANIPQNVRFAFRKMTVSQIDSLGTPYDYRSVMHYDKTAFGIRGRVTIRPKKPGVTLGNRRGPTATDIRQMNLLYKCSGGGGGGGGTTAPVTQRPVTPAPPTCADKDRRCRYWRYYCGSNNYVKANCLKTCGRCGGGGSCRDKDRRCPRWRYYCRTNGYVKQNCKKTCNTC